jgi:hypothetical protein
MAHARTTHEADCSSLARRFSGALLLMAIASLLVACGGGASAPAPSGGGGGAIACTTGTGAVPIVLTWDAVAVATGYRIYFGTSPGNYLQPSGVDVGPFTTYPVMGLSSGTTYYFAVTAYDVSLNESVFSNEVCKTIS